ncbi:MAG: hypothetical protein IBX69_04370 [Anaerolineales bacterium]|nr:hypothetical protein [Anaerolineales bacterium]
MTVIRLTGSINPNLKEQPIWSLPVLVVAAVLPLLGIYAQVYRYRYKATTTEQQQTKWAVFGLGLWMGYILVSNGLFFYLESLPP